MEVKGCYLQLQSLHFDERCNRSQLTARRQVRNARISELPGRPAYNGHQVKEIRSTRGVGN